MSDAIGPVHVKERPSVEMQSRIDAEVFFPGDILCSNILMSNDIFHFAKHLGRSVPIFLGKC